MASKDQILNRFRAMHQIPQRLLIKTSEMCKGAGDGIYFVDIAKVYGFNANEAKILLKSLKNLEATGNDQSSYEKSLRSNIPPSDFERGLQRLWPRGPLTAYRRAFRKSIMDTKREIGWTASDQFGVEKYKQEWEQRRLFQKHVAELRGSLQVFMYCIYI